MLNDFHIYRGKKLQSNSHFGFFGASDAYIAPFNLITNVDLCFIAIIGSVMVRSVRVRELSWLVKLD